MTEAPKERFSAERPAWLVPVPRCPGVVSLGEMCPTGRAGQVSSLRAPGVLGARRVRGQHSRSEGANWGSLAEPSRLPAPVEMPARPNPEEAALAPSKGRARPRAGPGLFARGHGIPRVAGGVGGAAGGDADPRPPAATWLPAPRHRRLSAPCPAAAARLRPSRPRPARAPNRRAAGARVTGAHCHAV